MKKLSYVRFSSTLVIVVMALAYVLTIVGMVLYRGGTALHQPERHFSLSHNFFSDLGLVRTYSGQSNLPTMILFMVGLIGAGAAIAIFSGAQKAIWRGRQRGELLGEFSAIFAVIAGGSFIAIAALPWDVNFNAHLVAVKLAFSFTALYSLSLLILQWRNRWPRRYTLANLVMVLALIGYVWLIFRGPSIFSLHGIIVQAIAQKVIVYLVMANFVWQAIGVRKAVVAPAAHQPAPVHSQHSAA